MSFKRQLCIYDEVEQQEKLKYWKDILTLDQWDIVAKIVRSKDMDLEESQANINFRICGLEAIVKQMDPIDWHNTDFDYDMEASLIHELLHLLFAKFKHEDEDGELEEQVINIIARALIGLKRQNEK
jgi:hypothetical protein